MQKKSKLNDQSGAYKAVLFDMDGTLIDTERIGAASWDHAGAEMGLTVPEVVKRRMVGRTLPDIHAIVREGMPEVDSDRLLARANHHYHRLVTEAPPPVKAGARELLEWLRARGVPMAVATSSRRVQAEDKLGRTGLRNFFEVIVGGDEISRGKPDPEIFLVAAERLGVEARGCVVFEDSGPGIEAAERSGGLAVFVPEMHPPDPAQALFAHRILKDLHEAVPLLEAVLEL
ncbi:MAG: HAD family phosphatase [Verrucomicrobia bacterium]|nr:HAD family phosphatase [Verrucomicrobiota bacterium]MCH8527481.1 HAD family phosphatase [Kiritimatiellia bacterium]